MSARESAETREAMRLLAAGLSYRKAAAQAGIALSTLWRAMQRHAPAKPAAK